MAQIKRKFYKIEYAKYLNFSSENFENYSDAYNRAKSRKEDKPEIFRVEEVLTKLAPIK